MEEEDEQDPHQPLLTHGDSRSGNDNARFPQSTFRSTPTNLRSTFANLISTPSDLRSTPSDLRASPTNVRSTPSSINYASINSSGPQLCYSPLLGNTGIEEVTRGGVSANGIEECEDAEEYKVYGRRWYILFLFSLTAMSQGAVWNTFGPISSTAEDAFGWKDSTIALLNNWGPISFLISGVFFSWAMDVKGLRFSCLSTAFLIALGAGLRCITMEPPAVTWLMHLGQALNGLAGPVAMAGPPAVSAVWFPAHQRTTATAIGTLFGMMGSAVGFIMGPLLVPDVPGNGTNGSDFSSMASREFSLHGIFQLTEDDVAYSSNSTLPKEWLTLDSQANATQQRVRHERNAICVYMYIEAGWTLALFLMMLIYFPKKPPMPPCATATIQRQDFFKGLKELFVCSKLDFWAVAFVYSVSIGVYNVWAGVIDVILKPYHIGEKEAGWIGFYSVCGGAALSLVIARLADYVTRIMKWLTLFFYTIGTAAIIIFILAIHNVIPTSSVLLYSTIIAGGTAVNAAVPLMYELACELTYPTGEGTTNGILTILCNFWGLLFLFVFMVPNIGSAWTNYTLLGSMAVCLPVILFLKERYNRLEIDEHNPRLTAEIEVAQPPASSSDPASYKAGDL